MKMLIVNADDFGFTRGVNAGIIRANREGIVTSATIMANGPAFEDAVGLALATPKLGVGIHLVAVGERAVASPDRIASLANSEGMLPATLTELALGLMRRTIENADIEREFRAQLERVRAAGITPTHFDTHKHSHTQPQVMEALGRVASDYGVRWVRNPFESFSAGAIRGPAASRNRSVHWKQRLLGAVVRTRAIEFRRLARRYGLRTPDRFYGVSLTGLLDAAAAQSIIESLKEGVAELMCHPGEFDAELRQARTRLKKQRKQELEALVSEPLRCVIEKRNVRLINYRELD